MIYHAYDYDPGSDGGNEGTDHHDFLFYKPTRRKYVAEM